jgi:hypothetical protein
MKNYKKLFVILLFFLEFAYHPGNCQVLTRNLLGMVPPVGITSSFTNL